MKSSNFSDNVTCSSHIWSQAPTLIHIFINLTHKRLGNLWKRGCGKKVEVFTREENLLNDFISWKLIHHFANFFNPLELLPFSSSSPNTRVLSMKNLGIFVTFQSAAIHFRHNLVLLIAFAPVVSLWWLTKPRIGRLNLVIVTIASFRR